MDDATSFVQQCRPPWVVFPEIEPGEISRYLKQGVTEAWFDQHWRPFWAELSAGQKQEYLAFWGASDVWREAIAFYFDGPDGFDVEADARESEEYLRAWRAGRK